MENIVDQDQQWLVSCLNATLDINQEVRSFAEASLNQASLQPGFGGALSKVAANKEVPLGLRQLAAVLLKQFVKKHWQEGDDSFEHPIASSEEKETIRRHLLMSLDDPHTKMCTAISMAVGTIASYDWPEDWPDLLPLLLKMINDHTNMNAVNGALRCLNLISGDMDDTMMPTLIPMLFPCLHSIVSSPQIFDKPLRSKALSIVHSCVSILGAMSGVYKTEVNAIMEPMITTWMDQFSIILEPPVQPEDPDDWCLRMDVLKCLNQFVQRYSSLTETEFIAILGPLWKTFVSTLRVYELSSIEGTVDAYQERYDSDGVEESLDSFVIQLFECLLSIIGSRKLVKVIGKNVEELVYYTVAFLQMTDQQIHTWSVDSNQYVADEDEMNYSCRVSGALLLEEVVSSCGRQGIDAIIGAATKRFSESQQQKAAGLSAWWRMREATVFALASLSEHLLAEEIPPHSKSSVGELIARIITEDIGISGIHEFPFLYARVFSSIAKFSSVINHEVSEQFLYAAIEAIGMDVPPPVKVGACRALSQLLPEAKKGLAEPHIMKLFLSLRDLLNQASNETLHLVLETLQVAVKAGHESSTSIELILSPVILNMWVMHVSDPFISIDAVEVLEAIKNAPGCIRPLVSRVVPAIGPILNNLQKQPDGLVAGSLDLVTMLLKNAPSDVVKALFDICFDSIIRIVLQRDDHSELQNATECLAAFVCGGKQEVLSWGDDSGFTMRSLLDAASRLLDPAMESSGSLFVGSYILQLILHLPSEMAQHMQDLTAALVRRMQSSQIAGLQSSLLLVFARLVHMSVPTVENFINLLITIPAEDYDNSLVYVMSEWTSQQGEIQGAYQIKVTTTALALLFATRHTELGKINVRGHLIKSNEQITTRSKAKLTPERWTQMPLPAKILALLADAMGEIQEQVLVVDDEDSDWEEVQGEGDLETDRDLLSSTGSTCFNRPTYDQLNAMAKVFNNENEEDGYEDDLLCGCDPLNEINLANYLVDFLMKFSQSDRPLFDHLCQFLTAAQRNAISMV